MGTPVAPEPVDADRQQYLERFQDPGVLSRRAFLGVAGVAAFSGGPAVAAVPRRIVSLDYALAETLLMMNRPPIGLADVPGWEKWVREPRLPAETVDVGLDLDPNLELIAALKPDLILTTDYVSRPEGALRRIADVERLTIYAEGNAPLARSAEIARILGERLGAASEAAAFLNGTETFFARCRERADRLAERRPLLLASLMDARHVRVYGTTSLFGETLVRMGLPNAWEEPVSFWGFTTIGIEDLARVGADARLAIFDPLPPDALPTLAESPIWTALPFVRANRVSRFPPILMFGALPSARRFAGFLLDELEAASA